MDFPSSIIRIGLSEFFHSASYFGIHVQLNAYSMEIAVPTKSNGTAVEYVSISLKPGDILQMKVEPNQRLIFIYVSNQVGKAVRKLLRMDKNAFDPSSGDQKINKIVLFLTEFTKKMFRCLNNFINKRKILIIDGRSAKDLLRRTSMNLQSSSKVLVKPSPPIIKKILTYPPPPHIGGVDINTADLATLEPGTFLNDTILDFYLKYLFYEKLLARDREKTHIFSSFFYLRLTQKRDSQQLGGDGPKTMQVRQHNQVKTWTKKVDIFSKDYIIIPVNQHYHWFLVIICHPGHVSDVKCTDVTATDGQEASKVILREEISNSEDMQNQDENFYSNSLHEVEEPPDASSEIPDSNIHPDGSVIFHESSYQKKETPCILIFDSLNGPNRGIIASTLREYLEMEWKIRRGTTKIFDRNTMKGFIVKCPKQRNHFDCGLYLLQYVESFFENPILMFSNPMPDFTLRFSNSKIAKKREQLKELILNLTKS